MWNYPPPYDKMSCRKGCQKQGAEDYLSVIIRGGFVSAEQLCRMALW